MVTTEAESNHNPPLPGDVRPEAEEEPKAPTSSNRPTALKSYLPVLTPIPVTIAIITFQSTVGGHKSTFWGVLHPNTGFAQRNFGGISFENLPQI
jgi:hypothetical protein